MAEKRPKAEKRPDWEWYALQSRIRYQKELSAFQYLKMHPETTGGQLAVAMSITFKDAARILDKFRNSIIH